MSTTLPFLKFVPDTLRTVFEHYGTINSIKVIRNIGLYNSHFLIEGGNLSSHLYTIACSDSFYWLLIVTGDSRGYAFIEFTDEHSAKDAFQVCILVIKQIPQSLSMITFLF